MVCDQAPPKGKVEAWTQGVPSGEWMILTSGSDWDNPASQSGKAEEERKGSHRNLMHFGFSESRFVKSWFLFSVLVSCMQTRSCWFYVCSVFSFFVQQWFIICVSARRVSVVKSRSCNQSWKAASGQETRPSPIWPCYHRNRLEHRVPPEFKFSELKRHGWLLENESI